ncbi:MAG: hypothetical protein L3J83_07830 [Proteobacteria bacterium]|nr:hypothetical protein [Pseudomonadota bacterium]
MSKDDIPDNIIKAFNIFKSSKELSQLRTALSNLFIEFDVDYREFRDELSNELVNTLLDKTNNKGLVMSKTGLSHRAVAKAIKQKNQPTVVPKKNLLERAISQLNTYCQYNKTQGMPKFLFYANMRTYNDGKTSIKAHLNKLFDTGIIREDEKFVYLELEKSIKKRNNEELISMLGVVINNLVNTVTFNKNKSSEIDSLFQMYIESSQIPPDLAPLAQKESLDALRVFYKQMINLLTKYETDVEPGTYPNIGLSLFQYNDNLKQEE